MIIGIDGNEANISRRVGVGWYAYNTLCSLATHQEHHFHIFLKSPPLPDMPPVSPHWRYHCFGPGLLWTRFALPFHLLFHHYYLGCLFSPSHYSPPFSPCPTIPTIHDLGYLKFKNEFTRKDLYQLIRWTQDSLTHAHHLLAVSRFTKNELIRIYHQPASKISIAYNGVGEPPPTFLPRLVTKPYFLALGTLKPNKNYSFLIQSFAKYIKKYHRDHLLVIAGKKGWLFDEIYTTVTKENLQNKVVFTDYITESQKWSYLRHALALVIPSTYEGFGIPAIEAQKVNTPVIASHIPPLKEILRDSALYIDPTNQSSLSQALESIVTDKKLCSSLRQKGSTNSSRFTWDKTAKSVLNSIINTCTNTSAKP